LGGGGFELLRRRRPGGLVQCLGHKLSESHLLLLVFPWAFSPRTLIRAESRDLCLRWAPAFAGVTMKSGHFDVGKIRKPDALYVGLCFDT